MIDDLDVEMPISAQPTPPDIVVRREWLHGRTALSLEVLLVVMIVGVAIGQGVWAVA